jgi:glycosyltransferase involved in cell wall biosynthesis
MISVFTPSFADEEDTNAQNLTVKEVVARLAPERFRVIMFYEQTADSRIAKRPNTKLLKWNKHGNTARMLAHFLLIRPDVYFFPREGPFDAAIFSLRQLLGLHTAVVSYAVTGGLENGIPRATLARNFDHADVVAANSAFLSQVMERRLGHQIPTVHDGVDRRYYYPKPDSRSTDKVVVLYAGSFRPYKRVDQVISAATRFPEAEFRIAGRGEEEQRCRHLAQKQGCQNVVFLGHLSQKALGQEMRRARVFFFPSELEGHPQVLLQAAACGLPCVALDSYHPEFVVHGETGFLATSGADLETKLGLLIGDRNLRDRMSTAALSHIQRFDWGRIVMQWEELFEIAVKNRKRR